MIQYPLISEYEVAIKKAGSGVLQLPDIYDFIPNRTVPIKFFNFGSGAFAGIFKVYKISDHKHYALRCFLNGGNPDNIERIINISNFLESVSDSWVCKNQIYRNGIKVKGSTFPIILMEWSSGKKINDYVSGIIADNIKITKLQEKLVELSHSLESKNIAHGDIQSGNILVEESGSDITLKLVDYDAMYVPTLLGSKAIETGHSSFQHPKRDKNNYNETIDRFSFWLMLTALEAIKFDKTLWNKDLRGGFNDEDNFLFKARDLSNPESSQLVSRLRNLNQNTLNFYLDKLFSNSISSLRDKVILYTLSSSEKSDANEQSKRGQTPTLNVRGPESDSVITDQPVEKFLIESVPTGAQVYLISGYIRTLIGATPLNLNMDDFASKQIVVSTEQGEKAFFLNRNEKNYRISFVLQQSSIVRYGVFMNGDKKYLTLPELENQIATGYKFSSVEVNGNWNVPENIIEIENIFKKYNIRFNSATDNPDPTVLSNTSTKNDSNLSQWADLVGIMILLVGVMIFIVIIYFISKKENDLYETVSYSDTLSTEMIDTTFTGDSLSYSTDVSAADAASAAAQEILREEARRDAAAGAAAARAAAQEVLHDAATDAAIDAAASAAVTAAREAAAASTAAGAAAARDAEAAAAAAAGAADTAK